MSRTLGIRIATIDFELMQLYHVLKVESMRESQGCGKLHWIQNKERMISALHTGTVTVLHGFYRNIFRIFYKGEGCFCGYFCGEQNLNLWFLV